MEPIDSVLSKIEYIKNFQKDGCEIYLDLYISDCSSAEGRVIHLKDSDRLKIIDALLDVFQSGGAKFIAIKADLVEVAHG